MSSVRAIVVTLRPRQWVKNAFVLAPLVFSKHLFDGAYAARELIAVGAFCALSGAVYAFNDVHDAEQDRRHPIKRHRPVAAGALSQRTALVVAAALAVAALGALAALDARAAAVGTGYLIVNLGYSLKLKQIAFLDVLLIAGGFLLRVLAGAFAIGVPVSPWLLLCTGLLAALLGFGKRAHELRTAVREEREVEATRAALAGYSLGMLTWAMYLLSVGTSVAYALYTRDARTVAYFGTQRLIWTLPFCIVGIGRFLQLALWQPRDDSPTDAILHDRLFMANILLWGGAVLAIIYGAK
jgi:4-hydroxybenzoate polyprenyltransferase